MKKVTWFFIAANLFLGWSFAQAQEFGSGFNSELFESRPDLLTEWIDSQLDSIEKGPGDRIVVETEQVVDDLCNFFKVIRIVRISKNGDRKVLFSFRIPTPRPCPSDLKK